jgi:glycosyltransferase involved in cell wall biosynthesis
MTLLTVLLPVYNGEEYLRETMQSILGQTCGDFEFLIVDDGSTDSSVEIIRSFSDPRIRLLHNKTRLKLSGALNRGMKEARGAYIARMDADDIALPERLERQVAYMEKHPEIGMCGTAIEIFGKGRSRVDVYPATSDEIKAYALFDCPFCHPTVMIRKDMFARHDLWYDGSFYPTEDYELWTRATELVPTVNLRETLLRYRVHDQSMTGADWDNMDREAARAIRPLLEKIGIVCSDEQLRFHRNIGRGRSCRLGSLQEVAQAEQWLLDLARANRQRPNYDEAALGSMLSLVWFRVCFNSTPLGLRVVQQYAGSRLARNDADRKKNIVLMLLSAIKMKFFRTAA